MIRYATSPLALLILVSILSVAVADDHMLKHPPETSVFFRPEESNRGDDHNAAAGTRWAVLIAGSNSYQNYRHQADVCHAYQILKKGGLKDENIIVFMYDDIAHSPDNPRPGIIVNSPHGDDVYKGVPKDYVGEYVTAHNFFAVIFGNKTALSGGSGKVLASGPNDHVFIYYTDHGGPGVLGMPNPPDLFAEDLVDALKTKHASGGYKSLVFYVEACESGSIFEGLLPEGLNIYAITSANTEESSYATYCSPEDSRSPPIDYGTCLSDWFSVAWMDDSEKRSQRSETLRQQYQLIRKRLVNESHAMQYGDLKLSSEKLFLYMGTNPENDNHTFVDDNFLWPSLRAVNQRDADLLHFWNKFQKAPEGSDRKSKAQKQFAEALSHRMHIDNSVNQIGNFLFGSERGPEMLDAVRPAGHPLVDDWDCLKSMVRTFEEHCGSLSQYGMKHMRSIANICNAGIQREQMAEASAHACRTIPANPWSSLHKGFSA